MTDDLALRWRGRIPIPEHAHPLVKRLITIANEQFTTMKEVAGRAGVSAGTISNWRYRVNPRVDLLEAALNVFDYELVIVKRKSVALRSLPAEGHRNADTAGIGS